MTTAGRRHRRCPRCSRFNRPEKLNAFDNALYDAAGAALEDARRRRRHRSASCSRAPATRSRRARTSPRWPHRSSRATTTRHRDLARLPALPRHGRRVREAAARGGERPRRRDRAHDAAALRPRVDRRHREAARAVRAARGRARSGGQPADAGDHGQPARVARALHRRLDQRRGGGRRGPRARGRARRRAWSTRRWRSRAGSPCIRCARWSRPSGSSSQAASMPSAAPARARGRDVRSHGRRRRPTSLRSTPSSTPGPRPDLTADPGVTVFA